MTKKKGVVVIIGISIFIILYNAFSINGVTNLRDLYTDNSTLENVYYLSQIMASVFVMIGAVIAVWQYLVTSRGELAKFKNDGIQKAINLAEFYKGDILKNYVFLRDVFERSGIKRIIAKAKVKDMKNFDQFELRELFLEEDLNIIREKISSREFAETVLATIEDRGYVTDNYLVNKAMKKWKNGKKDKITTLEIKAVRLNFLNEIMHETLNSLEYFAMNFTHNTADGSVVFPSLSPTYLEIVQLLYYNIAINNDGRRKLFSNVTELFNDWKNQAEKANRLFVNTGRSSFGLGNKAKSAGND